MKLLSRAILGWAHQVDVAPLKLLPKPSKQANNPCKRANNPSNQPLQLPITFPFALPRCFALH